jgi:hypothetical protein
VGAATHPKWVYPLDGGVPEVVVFDYPYTKYCYFDDEREDD